MQLLVERRSAGADGTDWDAFALSRPWATFFHLRAWTSLLEHTFSYRDCSLVATRGGKVCGLLPLLLVPQIPFGRSLISTPFGVYGGICADDAEAGHALLSHARELGRELGVRYVELRQLSPIADLPVKDLYVTFKRRIFSTQEENMAAIPRNQRRSIRIGIANGLTSRIGDLDLLEGFYHVYSHSMRNHGTPVFPKRLFAGLLREFGSSCRILGVFHQNRMVAGVMTFLFRDLVMPYYGGALRDGFRLAANDFMYWSLMCYGMREGFEVFDFGRSKVNSGSYHFKRHWGFEPVPLPYQFLLIRQSTIPDLSPHNPRFAAPIRFWRRIPLGITQWLGPKVIRYFP